MTINRKCPNTIGSPTPSIMEVGNLATLNIVHFFAMSPEIELIIRERLEIERCTAALLALDEDLDADHLQRNLGMRRPTYTIDDIAMAYNAGLLLAMLDELQEYNRRLQYVRRRFSANGRLDLD